jgi:hypothetical protein
MVLVVLAMVVGDVGVGVGSGGNACDVGGVSCGGGVQ